ncbi:MAG: EFR1 family ferrodoxin [Coriobacteriales bacterium]|jgi:ferredoxin|nr:EFR1 family ferrodoxin [Coriobacteriales bacterium]
MYEHVIYYYSGTGNSLWTALALQRALGSCEVLPIGESSGQLPKAQSIGFVFPCHFGGVPGKVLDFFANLDTPKPSNPYCYAVVTYGVMPGAALGQAEEALGAREITLNNAVSLKSFASYVVGYDMSDKVAEKTAEAKESLQEILPSIIERETAKIKKPSPLLLAYNKRCTNELGKKDENFVVSESCESCGTCRQVCSAHNIRFDEGRPHWLNHCEQCLACLQWCPKHAINYGEKTRNRGRYTHPEITSRLFIENLNRAGASSSEQ